MDELEILKRDWKKNENSFNQVTEKEIVGMLQKRSSSIVKWIFIVSVCEFLFWTLIGVVSTDESYFKKLEMLHLNNVITILSIIGYLIVFYFIYKFYTNYKKINATDSVKKLMQNILNTRKTVKYYIWYNLAMIFISFILVFVFSLIYDPVLLKMTKSITKDMNEYTFYFIISFVFIIFTLVIIVMFWLFYKLLYGILLKHLHKNYEELKKLEL